MRQIRDSHGIARDDLVSAEMVWFKQIQSAVAHRAMIRLVENSYSGGTGAFGGDLS
jgi:hypothetical protein